MSKEKFRVECEAAAVKVDKFTAALSGANASLWADAGNATKRRLQRQAFNELSQAQFEMEQAFDRLSPDIPK